MEWEDEDDGGGDGRGKELRWRLGRIFISGLRGRGQMEMDVDVVPLFPCVPIVRVMILKLDHLFRRSVQVGRSSSLGDLTM